MVEIGKWTFKLTRLVGTASQPFSSIYLENYHGRDQKMDIQIDKVSWHFISAIFFLGQFLAIHSC
jgi:hypothetical protein